MADNTPIEWTDATWNPITGCTLVSEGCRHCYAARLAATRLQHHPSRKGLARLNAAGEAKVTGEVRFNVDVLDQPLRWKRPRMIFVCAHGDLFHESVPDDWIDMVFAVMALCPQHTFQVLTKRPERMRRYMTAPGVVRRVYELACDRALEPGADVILIPPGIDEKLAPPGPRVFLDTWPIANVWLGTSIEDQPTADTRIPYLLQTPAAVRWISAEPLLGPVNLNAIHEHFDTLGGGSLDTWESALNGKRFDPWSDGDIGGMPKLDWVVAGGESGPGARPMHPDWARSLRDQCAAAGVPFLFKQWGEWAPTGFTTIIEADGTNCPPNIAWPDGTIRWGAAAERGGAGMQLGLVGKKASGRLLDGVEYNGFPVRP